MAVTTQHTQRFVKFVNQQLDLLKEERRTIEGAADDFIYRVQCEVDTWVSEGLASHSTFDEISNRIQQAITFFITKSVELSEISVREDTTQVIRNKLSKLEEALACLKTKAEHSQLDRQKYKRKLKEMSILQVKNSQKIENLSDENVKSKKKNVEQFMDLEEKIQNIKSNFDSMFESVTKTNGRLNKLEEENKSVNVSMKYLIKQISSVRTCSNDALMSIQDLSKSAARTNQHYNEMSNKMNNLEISMKLLSSQYTEQLENMRSHNKDKVEDMLHLVCQILAKRLTPLEGLRDHLNTTLNARKQMALKVEAIDTQLAEISGKVTLIERKLNQPTLLFNALRILSSEKCTNIDGFIFVLTNNGSHFDPSSGTFTAPRSAFYLISIHVIKSTRESFKIRCVRKFKDMQFGCERTRQICCVSEEGCVTCLVELHAKQKISLELEFPENEIMCDMEILFSCVMIKQ